MSEAVLVDTGPIVAMLKESDEHHTLCIDQLHQIEGRLYTCWPVITKALWILRKHPFAASKLLSSFHGQPYDLAPLTEADLSGITSIMAKYAASGVQLADASLVHLANREGIDTIFTLDRRDFGVMRLAHAKRIRIVP